MRTLRFSLITCGIIIFLIMSILSVTPVALGQEGETIKEIKKRGTLRAGVLDYPPFMIQDKKTNEWTGHDIEIVRQFAKFLKVEPEFVKTTWAMLITGLLANKYDITCNQYRTPERVLSIWFTAPYFESGQGFLIRKEDQEKYKTLADFNKETLTISVTMGSAGAWQLPKLTPKAKVKEVPGSPAMSKLEVQAKRADANWSDIPAILDYARANPWAYVVNPKEPFFRTPIAFGLRKGDLEFLFFLDAAIIYLKTQGTLDEIADKYIFAQ